MSQMNIHPTAVVDPNAKLGNHVEIGPYCVVGPHVTLGEGVTLLSHVVIDGYTSIGDRTKIFPFASIGHQTQDKKYKGEKAVLTIGTDNVIREHVTMNPGTETDGGTRVGSHGLFMVGCHVAHDCQVGDNVILSNNATLAGHVHVGDYAILGGLTAVHQFVRIGSHAMVGGMSGVEHNVIPYGSVMGDRARLCGLNIIGLKRRGFDRTTIHSLRSAYRMLFAQEGTMQERIEDVAELFREARPVMDIIDFIRIDSNRSFCQPREVESA